MSQNSFVFLQNMRYVSIYGAAAFGIVAYILHESVRPPLLIVGDVTVDIVDGKKVPGGAVSYSAAVAEGYGLKARVVTAGGKEADFSVFDGHYLHVVQTESTLTFEHTYTWWGNHRKLRVIEEPDVTIRKSDVPWNWRCARTVLLGPLTQNDIDASSFLKYSWFERILCYGQQIGLFAQGYQRALDLTGKVSPVDLPSEQLLSGLAKNVSVFLSDVETDSWGSDVVQLVSRQCHQLLITRGAEGATLYKDGNESHVDAVKVKTVDTNGAGDVFSTTYMISMMRGSKNPGHEAALAASRAVMLTQSCKPKCVSDSIQTMLKNEQNGYYGILLHKLDTLYQLLNSLGVAQMIRQESWQDSNQDVNQQDHNS
eukprot:TRINITY_DN4017_c0_g1_i1.p1 TRINITY_DN4017_c0_g1~~TRINITY_DN4017_c0_g1_i1.p1  ORF type:complete len:429 (+),score=49.13 TRINITY_DN4017_c0_g1_i1:183-1289(+)